MTHISLALVGLMWVLPFLYYHHAYPITTFYQEWGAAVLGLCAMFVLVTQRYWQQPQVPRIVMLPIGLMLLVLVQYLLGKLAYFDQALLLTLYLMWAALLMMLGQYLREELGLSRLTTILAGFLLLGAELNAAAGILQHYRWHTWLDSVITVKTSLAVYGNMAQPNHFADYISLGLISLGLLHMRAKLRVWQVLLLVMPLLFVLVLSGSRSAWFYLLAMNMLALVWLRRDPSGKPLMRYTLLLLLGFGLMHLIVQMPALSGAAGSIDTVQRMFAEAKSGSVRLYLWRESVHIFLQYPWLGAGFGQFAWQHFIWVQELHATHVVGLYNNAHNLVMQLAAEMGLAGIGVLFATLALWVRQAWRSEYTLYHWWGHAVLAVLAIHSLLEYPLWYAYFLGVAAITLGVMDNTTYRLEMRNLGRLAVASMLLLSLLSMAQLLVGYRSLHGLTVMRPTSAADESYYDRVNKNLAEVNGKPMLYPYAEYFMSSMIEASAAHLDEKLALNGRVMHFVPVSTVVYRQAWLLALSGRTDEAKIQLERAIWSYPGDFAAAHRELSAFALKDPAHFAALLEFAVQKNKEHQIAVHTN